MVPVTGDPIAQTLDGVLDALIGGVSRERSAGELLANASWWLDVASGAGESESRWALKNRAELVEARLTEAPYLAAIGYLVHLGVLQCIPKLVEAATRIAKRAPHTVERTGYADDPLVLAGIWLLHRRAGSDASALRRLAVDIVSKAGARSSVVMLLVAIDGTLAQECRPFVVRDSMELAIAAATALCAPGAVARCFPGMDRGDWNNRLLAAACAGELDSPDPLERTLAAIALVHAIGSSTQRGTARKVQADEGPVDIAVLVALKEEFRHLYAWLKDVVPLELEGHHYYRAVAGAEGECSVVATFVGDMGPAAAAITSTRLLERWRPSVIVLLGVGGSVSKDVSLGDVVVATQVDSYMDSGKAIDADGAYELLPSGAVFRTDPQFVGRIRNLEFARPVVFEAWRRSCEARYAADSVLAGIGELDRGVQLHEATIASGPIVGASDAFREWLLRRERAYKAIEMEGGAVLRAAEAAWDPPRTLVVRGISDRADPQKSALDDTGRGAIRAWAMHNAIGFVWALIDAGLLRPSSGAHAPSRRDA